MAVYTDITEIELAAFLAEYDLGEALSYKGIAEGSENSNFFLHTTTGSFILTLYERRVEVNDLPFFLKLMQHLAMKGINCPLPVERRDGRLIGELAGRPAAIITFLEGVWVRRPTPSHCRELGRAVAELHVAGSDFGMTRANTLAIEGWKHLWAQARPRAEEVEQGLVAEIDAEFAAFDRGWPENAPKGVIHADLFPDNVFFIGEKLSGMIDFYFACNDLFAYDVATCMNAWCFEKDHSFNLTKCGALLAGYESVRPLTAVEKSALPLLARGSALRFLLTRLYDWLTVADGALVQKRDPTEFIRRLRFHRHVESAAEYGLDI